MLKNKFLNKTLRQLTRFLPQIKLGLILLLIISLSWLLAKAIQPVKKLLTNLNFKSSDIVTLTQNPKDSLKNTAGRTNVLLMGIGGEGHQAPDLTDSIMVISYDHDHNSATIISVPRDLYSDSLKAKINTAYHYGNERDENGGGLRLAKSSIEELIGLPIHYAFVIDFAGFTKAIDMVGGVDLTVANSFDDYHYPIPGKENDYPLESRYEHLHFDAGPQHMDGDTALKFVRSRYAEGDEGTDFARSQRQQLVISAFKDKLLSTQTLLNPDRLSSLIDLYSDYTDTDLTGEQYLAFAKIVLKSKDLKINSIPLVADDNPDHLSILQVGPKQNYDGQYVLIPRDNNLKALQLFISNQLNQSQ